MSKRSVAHCVGASYQSFTAQSNSAEKVVVFNNGRGLYTGKWDTDTAFDISVRQRLLADVNGDGRVDTTDVQLLMAAVWAQQKQEQETP